ncbi:acyl-CoA dehydrogenase family protein [Phenylobacterium montanum]|uniref:Acyl-CoA dehydrogenase family protein n=1 Tax=Phenylobacterium montanum TaxID=2823693 RepID=A0A975G3B5_9CAUL|nr:acyl-CoA dehydrogenase family protein [Caulobacter sp. S6]QUD90365.1 acyl-CoA dehydrogenase family protein [Caulobacter sp. S6]
MAWDFETDPDFQARLDWAAAFVKEEVEPLDHRLDSIYDVKNPENARLVRPLQAQVKEQGLWACHLGPELGGPGYGQVKLALLNEILGRSHFAPVVFGCQAPDTGNAEILAHYGTAEQKAKYLKPLLDNEIVSCFSMTEPHGGADPLVFTCRAERDAGGWVINGEKWFSSNARFADFLIVMAVTDPEAAPHRRMSMFIVPADAPGIEIVRNVGHFGEKVPSHAYVRYTNVRIPADHLLGERGEGFAVAQTRLGGGRIHHAMRTIGQAQKALDMMCERALSRFTAGERLSDKQMVQEKIADSWIELRQFRLLVLETAWRIDKLQDYRKVRKDIAAVKAAMPKVLHDIAARALQIHGSIGVSDEMPFVSQVVSSFVMGLADGPTEVHKVTVAKQVLRDYAPTNALFPAYDLIAERERSMEKYPELEEMAEAELA